MTEQKNVNLKIDTVKTEPCILTFKVELPAETVSKETEKVYQQIQGAASLPGFRKGKSPMEKIKQQYAKYAQEEVTKNLLTDTVSQIIKEKNIQVSGTPKVEEVNFCFDKPFSFKVVIERLPEFEPKDYKKIPLNKKIKKINEKDIKETINKLLDNNSYLVDSLDKVAEKKHFVIADYTVIFPDNSKPPQKVKDQIIDLSKPQLVEGFAAGVIGMKPNEEKDIEIAIPKDSPQKELAGKKLVFKTIIKFIKDKKLPELNDQFAKQYGVKDLKELEQKIKEELEKQEMDRVRRDLEDQIAAHLLKSNPVPVPPSEIEERLKEFLDNMCKYYKQQGMNEETWIKELPGLKDKYRPETEKSSRLGLVFWSIAKKENLELKDDIVIQYILENAKVKETHQ